MQDWSAGYVTDVNYSTSFYPDQIPQHLAFICLMNGFAPLPVDRPFRYCELGCGLGITASVVAAGYPDSRVTAVDFNPAHIAEARSLAAEAGLDNLDFREQSFAELLAAESTLPEFDFITLHGVYTWIATEDRRRIVEILRRKLRPGGIVYLSYNALPGWSGGEMLQRLIREVGRASPERSDRQFERGLDFAKSLRDAGLARFQDNELLERICQARDQGLSAYLTHEYMNGHWQPMFHADVARELADAKLTFVGSSNALANFPDLNLSEERQQMLQGFADPTLRETLKDFFVPRLLRKDVYVRGARRLTRARQEALIGAMRIALTRDRAAATREMTVPIGQIAVEERVFEPVFDALAQGPKTLADLLAVAGTEEKTGAKAVEIAGLIIGSEQGAAALPAAAEPPAERIRRLNAALARRAADQPIGRMGALAAAALGGGVPATGLEMRAWLGLDDGLGEDPAALARSIWAPLAAEGERLIKNGTVLETEEEALTTLRSDMAEILARRCPVWRRLGAL